MGVGLAPLKLEAQSVDFDESCLALLTLESEHRLQFCNFELISSNCFYTAFGLFLKDTSFEIFFLPQSCNFLFSQFYLFLQIFFPLCNKSDLILDLQFTVLYLCDLFLQLGVAFE
jgi:hypothetical protein